jgi:hypothetical protein
MIFNLDEELKSLLEGDFRLDNYVSLVTNRSITIDIFRISLERGFELDNYRILDKIG